MIAKLGGSAEQSPSPGEDEGSSRRLFGLSIDILVCCLIHRHYRADLSKGDFSSKGRYSEDGVPTMARHRDGGGQTSLAAFKIRKPTIAAINGHAIGIGESEIRAPRFAPS